MERKGIRPGFRFGLDRPLAGERYQRRFPFRRYWPAILFLLVFDIIFLIPAISAGREALEMWRAPDDLFNLVAALFMTLWLLGWSMAPLSMTAILLVMVFGRETVRVRPGMVQVDIGLPLLSLGARYNAAAIRNLRLEHPAKKSGKSWRGSHVAFDYGANGGAFGSALTEQDFQRIQGQIETAAGTRFRRGEASAEELAGEWASGLRALSATAGEGSGDIEPIPATKVAGDRPLALNSPSVLALVAANLLVLAGAAFYGWDLGMVMVLYWAESAIIGFFNLCKIVVIGRWMALPAGLFFLGHFGGFMAVHFLFLYTLFVQGPSGQSGSADLAEVAAMFGALWPALAVLFFSHAYSFIRNFLGQREYRGRTVKYQMHEPYSRVIFMHLVLIFGGALTLVLGQATPVLMAIIVLKIVVDVRSHLKQRQRAEAGARVKPGGGS